MAVVAAVLSAAAIDGPVVVQVEQRVTSEHLHLWPPHIRPSLTSHAADESLAGEDEVEQREVEVGRALGSNGIQILSGLSAGEDVVLDPPAALADGSRVTVTTQ